jgi:hypothetical protein
MMCDSQRENPGLPASAFPRLPLQCRARGGGQGDAIAIDDFQRVGAGGRIGHGRAGGDGRQIVARHVGNRQRDHARRWAASARRPPLIAERCLRTQLISAMLAPQASSALVTARFSSSVMPVHRRRQQGRTAAGQQHQHQVVRPRPCTACSRRVAACCPAASGVGCEASTTSMRRVGSHGHSG